MDANRNGVWSRKINGLGILGYDLLGTHYTVEKCSLLNNIACWPVRENMGDLFYFILLIAHDKGWSVKYLPIKLTQDYFKINALDIYYNGLVHAQSLSHVWLSVTPWTVACQAPLPMEFSRWEFWNELPFPTGGNLPDPEIELESPALADGFFTTLPPEKSNRIWYKFSDTWFSTKEVKLLKSWQSAFHCLVTSFLFQRDSVTFLLNSVTSFDSSSSSP